MLAPKLIRRRGTQWGENKETGYIAFKGNVSVTLRWGMDKGIKVRWFGSGTPPRWLMRRGLVWRVV